MDIAVLQRVLAILRADTAITSMVSVRIFDRAPHGDGCEPMVSPYITLGPHDTMSEDGDCMDLQELNFQIDVWSFGNGEAYSRAQAGKLANLIRDALHRRDETINGVNVEIAHVVTRHLRHDNLDTNHAAIGMRAIIG